MESKPTGREMFTLSEKKVECHLECSYEVISATKCI